MVAQPTGNKNTILIVAIVGILSIAAFFIFGNKKETPTADTEGGATGGTTTPPTGGTTTPTPVTKCGFLKYERDEDDPPFVMLDNAEMWTNNDSFIRSMQKEGHSDDYLSYAGAFLKGMDLALKVSMVKKYKAEIANFKQNAKIKRNSKYSDELQQQTYDVGALVCKKNALMRMLYNTF